MILKDNGIFDMSTWKTLAPPMGGDKQWREGRSAMELARYMTENYPTIPKEIEEFLSHFTDTTSEFSWCAEYVTNFQSHDLGKGEGRNHDAFLAHPNVIVGIEAKTDEPLGSQLIAEALKNASENKQNRINKMIQMIFGDTAENHSRIRYQLVTATAAMLLEAEEHHVQNAALLVIVFKKNGCFDENKIKRNHTDIDIFLEETSAVVRNDYFVIPTVFGQENGIDLFFKYIEISLD